MFSEGGQGNWFPACASLQPDRQGGERSALAQGACTPLSSESSASKLHSEASVGCRVFTRSRHVWVFFVMLDPAQQPWRAGPWFSLSSVVHWAAKETT